MASGSAVPPHACHDPAELIQRLEALHEACQGEVPSGEPGADALRAAISASWRRSRAAGVDTGITAAPLVFDADRLPDARAAHPLGPYLPMMREMLVRVADESEHLMVITDGEGHALWSEGPAAVRRAADRVGLTEGFCWSEGSIGTNGIGTALAEGCPQYVYSAEHLARVLHRWSCVGAPVTDPDTGEPIGCVDISATVDRLHPAYVALVGAVARLTEAELAKEMSRQDEILRERYTRHLRGITGALVTATGRVLAARPADWRGRRLATPLAGVRMALPDGRLAVAEPLGEVFLLRRLDPAEDGGDRPLLTLTLLDGDQPQARLDGRPLPLSLRHAEILALLALHPQGLTADQLSWHIYGDEGNPVTVRAEIHRLRAQLGDLLRAKPYRLDCEVDADFLTVRRLLAEGGPAALARAARLYRGELLPRSDSPALRAERDELAARFRGRLLGGGGVEALWAYAQSEPGQEDPQIMERLAALLPPGDPRLLAVRHRARRLNHVQAAPLR